MSSSCCSEGTVLSVQQPEAHPDWIPPQLDIYKRTGAIPKNHPPSPQPPTRTVPLTLDLPYSELPSDQVTPPSSTNKLPLTSPKVLFSKKSPGQGYYLRDIVYGLKDSTSTDSDQSSPELDRYLKNFRPNAGLEPLSPQEIQTYLCSLDKRRDRSVSPPLVLQASAHNSRVRTKLSFNDAENKASNMGYCGATIGACERVIAASKNCRSLSPLTKQLQQYQADCRPAQSAQNQQDQIVFTIGEKDDESALNGEVCVRH